MDKQSRNPDSLPLVSIVIPAYNAASYLQGAIDSVLAQDYPNIELIVLNDGSTDNSVEILRGYPKGCFYWESHSNMGQSATLNKGWAMAKGEILSYLSADDALLPGGIYCAVEALKKCPETMMVYGDYELMDAQSNVFRQVKAPDFSFREMLEDIVVHPGPGVFFRRACFDQLGGWDVKLKQTPDYDYWLRMALIGQLLHLPATLAQFRVHEQSQSYCSTSVEKSDEIIQVLESFFLRNDISSDIQLLRTKSLAMAYVVAARFHLRAGKFSFFWERLLQAVKLYPRVLFKFRTLQLLSNAIKHRVMFVQ